MEGYSTLSEAELRRILAGVESLPDVVAGHDVRLDNHDTQLANHEGRITTLEAAIITPPDLTALTAVVAGHEVRLDGHDGDISTLVGRVDGHDTAVSTLSARTDALDNRIDGHDLAIADLQVKAPRVVYSEADLLTAMATPGKIWVVGLLTLSTGVISTTDDLDFDGVGTDAGFLLPHNGSSQQTVMWVRAQQNKFRNLKFTTDHPLISGRTFQDIGLRLAVGAGQDCSGLECYNCTFENLGWGVLRDGSSSSEVIHDVVLDRCHFKGIFQGCVYIRWHCHRLQILNCDFEQRTASQTHDIEYNAIYIANRCDGIVVTLNKIKRFGRHGIEIWNDTDDPLAADSNQDPEVTFNTVEEPLPWSTYTPIGITILGKGVLKYFGNVVRDCVISYELGGDNVNDGHHLATHNTAIRTKNQAFSVNGSGRATVKKNIIDRVAVDGFPGITNHPIGVQIINGARHVKIHENDFFDAGRYHVWCAGRALTITGITNAADGVFTVSSFIDGTSRPNGWYPGKRICLRGIGGMTQLNDRYYAITEISGLTFKIGVDTSAMGAYTSGGRVQENYIGLSICNNEFWVNDEIDPAWSGPSLFARAIYLHDIQQAMVKSNNRYVSADLSGFWGTFSLINYGVVYQDHTGGSVSTTGAEVVIAGSNHSIAVFPE